MMEHILIVDDDDGILDALGIMLESVGYKVKKSITGDPLLHLNINDLPDLILLDVLLSGNDGRELCKVLKENPETKHIPIIMLSAHPTAQQGVKACGADDYLKKPFNMNDLLMKIKKHLPS